LHVRIRRQQQQHVLKPIRSSRIFYNTTTSIISEKEDFLQQQDRKKDTIISFHDDEEEKKVELSFNNKRGTFSDSNNNLSSNISKEKGTTTASSLRRSPGVTQECGGTLAETYGIHCRLDRMALMANGNLQRLFSSYYDAPVSVVVDRCDRRKTSTPTHNEQQNQKQIWDRLVHLKVYNQVFCTAKSKVIIYDTKCQHLIESGEVGLGQLFQYLNRLPMFVLCDAGYNNGGGLYRIYELNCKEVSCRIREDFHPSAWNINP